MQKEKKEIKHISSNQPLVFLIQALTVVCVIFVVAFVFYVIIFGESNKLAVNLERAQNNVVNLMQSNSVLDDGIDESMFVDNVDGVVDSSKIENLFPNLK